jgi:hypothetical protein
MFGVIMVAYVWLKPFMPYIRAKLDKKDILFLIGKDNKIRLIPAKYSSGIYNTAVPPYSFLHKNPRAFRFGDLQAVFVHDSWGVTLDPDFAEVIEELKLKGVTDYEELELRLSGKDAKGRKYADDELLTHSDIIRTHAFHDVDFGAFLAFAADMTPTEIRSHIDEVISKFLEDTRKLDGTKPSSGISPMFIVIIIIVAAGGYLAMKQFGMM